MKPWAALSSIVVVACASTSGHVPLPDPPAQKTEQQLAAFRVPPPLAPPTDVAAHASVQRFALDNGLGVSVVARPKTSLTTLALWVPSATDRTQGTVATMADALRAGTLFRAGTTLINPKLAGAGIEIETGPTGTTFSWQVLAEATAKAVELMAAFVLRPAFEEREVKIRLQQALDGIRNYSGSWDHATQLARSAIPGWEMSDVAEDARGILALKAERLGAVHRCRMRPTGAELLIVGPVSPDEAVSWARAAFGAWDSGQALKAPGCEGQPAKAEQPGLEPQLLAQPVAQLIQGSNVEPRLVIVVPGPPVRSDEFQAFRVLSYVLDERERRRVPHLLHRSTTGRFGVNVNDRFPRRALLELAGHVPTGKARLRLSESLAEVRGLSHSLTAPEVEVMKLYLRTVLIDQFSSNHRLAKGMLRELGSGGRAADVNDWEKALGRVDLASCRAVAERWLREAQPSIVIAGVREELAGPLGIDADVRKLSWSADLQAPAPPVLKSP